MRAGAGMLPLTPPGSDLLMPDLPGPESSQVSNPADSGHICAFLDIIGLFVKVYAYHLIIAGCQDIPFRLLRQSVKQWG